MLVCLHICDHLSLNALQTACVTWPSLTVANKLYKCVCVCVNSCASTPGECIGDPAEGTLGHGDLECPSGRHRHRIRHLTAGTIQQPRIIAACIHWACTANGPCLFFFLNWMSNTSWCALSFSWRPINFAGIQIMNWMPRKAGPVPCSGLEQLFKDKLCISHAHLDLTRAYFFLFCPPAAVFWDLLKCCVIH